MLVKHAYEINHRLNAVMMVTVCIRCTRPSLLTEQGFGAVPAAVQMLQKHFEPADMDALVEAQPWLLDARADDWLHSLKR